MIMTERKAMQIEHLMKYQSFSFQGVQNSDAPPSMVQERRVFARTLNVATKWSTAQSGLFMPARVEQFQVSSQAHFWQLCARASAINFAAWLALRSFC